MEVSDRHMVGRQGVALVQTLAVNDLRWLFREQDVSDFGIDAQLEVVVEGRATGHLLALQIKSGDSQFREPSADGFVYRGDQEHLEYWLNHVLPVVVVICWPSAQEAYWQVISEETVVRTGSAWKMVIPKANRLNSEAVDPLHEIAARRAELGTMGADKPEPVTHADSMLGVILASPQLLDTGRCEINTSSITYICSRIAALDDLVAVLVSANSIEGTVFVLRRTEGRWGVRAQFPISTRYAESLPAFFVPGKPDYCLVVRHPTGWGTGTVLYEEKWLLLSRKPHSILEYPVEGYVVGWGLLFDRKIIGELVVLPSALRARAHVELAMKVYYCPSSQIGKYEGIDGFDIAKTIRLEWDDSKGTFSLLSGSDMSPDETLGLYADGDAAFVTRNLDTLKALANGAGGALMTWLRDLAERAGPADSETLRRALVRPTV